MMNSGVKLRLGGFVAAIGLLVFMVVWIAVASWRRVDDSRARLASLQSDRFRVASHLQQTILGLNEHLLSFTLRGDTNDLVLFESEWASLGRWMDEQPLSSPAETGILHQIHAAYDDYHTSARLMGSRRGSNRGTNFQMADIVRCEGEASRVLKLISELGEARRQYWISSLATTDRSLARLLGLLFGALVVLLTFAGWLAVVVHRQLIAPLQVKLVESQALLERQEKLASLGVLAAGVAHEIRNPLTAIKAWLFMHQRKLRADTQEHADAEIIANEIERLERIVKDFLLFARPSEPELEVVRADQPLREVRELLAPQLEASNIQLILDNLPPAWVRIDAHQIKQVLINLVQNAADAISQNGTVTLRARLDRKRLGEREMEVVILEVADTGKGIPAEAQKRLFDPFFTTKESGTGLGLPIAARIVEKHGGSLQYQTQVDHGTIFGIVLPRVERHEHKTPASSGKVERNRS